MPFRQSPAFKNQADKMLEIAQAGIGGLNLKDLEYEQEVTQSPYMINMMYRNGAFSKRYGQEYFKEYNDNIYALTIFKDELIDEGLNASIQNAFNKYKNTYKRNYSKLSEEERRKSQIVVDIANQEILDELIDIEKEIKEETDKIIASYDRY